MLFKNWGGIFFPMLINSKDNLFYWLWPKIFQNQLDKFVEYWNNHKIRPQPYKSNF